MKKLKKSELFRILDANFNRSREGLRVCEEIMRFLLGNKALTADLKKTRHAITDVLKAMPLNDLVASRNVVSDFGKEPSILETDRKDIAGLFLANAQRSKESLRVLEETSKLLDDHSSIQFKKIRFQVYAIEKRALPKLEALRYHR